MYKSYVVDLSNHDLPSTLLAQDVPEARRITGPKVLLHPTVGDTVEVEHAGEDGLIDFNTKSFIFTRGLLNCFAVCAVWGGAEGRFAHGYLAHVSSPGPPPPSPSGRGRGFVMGARGQAQQSIAPSPVFFETVVGKVPPQAWVVVGTSAWEDRIAQAFIDAGFAEDHIWIYSRAANGDVGFCINQFGHFGEL